MTYASFFASLTVALCSTGVVQQAYSFSTFSDPTCAATWSRFHWQSQRDTTLGNPAAATEPFTESYFNHDRCQNRKLTTLFISRTNNGGSNNNKNEKTTNVNHNNQPSPQRKRRSRQALPLHATATMVEPPTTVENKKRTSSSPKYSSSTIPFHRRSMLDHDLLTKEEEQELGRAIQKARHYQQLIQEMVDSEKEGLSDSSEKQLQQSLWYTRRRGSENKRSTEPLLPQKRYDADIFVLGSNNNNNNNQLDIHDAYDDFIDEDDDEMQQLSIVGLDQLEQLETSYFEEASSKSRGESPILGLPGTLNKKSAKRKKEDWFIDAVALKSLTNKDVVERLGLAGGRAELNAIMLRGAIAREKLIRSNVKLVTSIAKKWAKQQRSQSHADKVASIYSGSWDRPSLDEAVQEGIVGLASAADRYEPERNWRFGTYATFWITNYVRRCFQTYYTTGLRVPVGFHDVRVRFRALVKSYHDSGIEVPPLQKLAQQLDITTDRLETILRVTRPVQSIDAPLYTGARTLAGKAGNTLMDNTLLADLLVDENDKPDHLVDLSLLRQSLENAMASELVPYERDILRLRLGLDDGVTRTVPQICQVYGGAVTQAEIRSAEARAYKKLRSPQSLSTYKLLTYCDFAGIDRAEVLMRR